METSTQQSKFAVILRARRAAIKMLTNRTRLTALSEAGDRAAGSDHGTRMRTVLVTAQVIMSFVLLVCAGLMMRTLYNLLSIDPGFRPAQVLSMQLNLNWTRYKKDSDKKDTENKDKKDKRKGEKS